MVKLLFQKMYRDMKRSAVTYAICIVIVAVGFCGYCVLSVTADHLMKSRDYLFEQCSFSEVFAEVYAAPATVTRSLEKIEGIEQVEARLVKQVRVWGLQEEEAELKLISITDGGFNRPLLFQGEMPFGKKSEMVLGDAFLKYWKLQTGDTITIVVNGRKENLNISGSGISPENIYMIKNMLEMMPDPAVYDAGFVSYDKMETLFGMEGMANDFVFSLMPGVTLEDVKDDIEEVLKPYGCYNVYDRSDQLSASMLQAELNQVDKMSSVMPFLFLSVAAIILYITLNRLIEKQRVQAGTLMALGIPRRIVAFHYMGYGMAVGILGGFVGGLLGNLSAGPLVEYYQVYFNLPDVSAPVSMKYLIMGTIVSAAFCGFIGWQCARGIGTLNPSEALRPPTPKAARISFLEKIPGFLKLLTVPGVMAIRSITRNRRRSLMSMFGIACAFMITASLVSMNTLFDVFMFDFLEQTQRQDVTVYFNTPVAAEDAMQAVRNKDVELAEGIVEVPVTLTGPDDETDCTIQAISESSELCKLYNEQDNEVFVQREGIVLSVHMASLLGVKTGDFLEIKVSYPEEKISKIPVTGLISQYMGTMAYMSYEGLASVSEYRNVYTSVLLKAPDEVQEGIMERLEDSPVVLGMQSRGDKVQKFRDMMGSFEVIMASMVMLGVIIGLAVIYTSSLISFEELKREISTMMMLGVNSRLCLDVISVGQWILTIGGILLGIPLTMWVSHMITESLTTDLYSLPDFVDTGSIIWSIGLIFVAVFLSSRIMLRRLRKISPVELLRERE